MHARVKKQRCSTETPSHSHEEAFIKMEGRWNVIRSVVICPAV